MSFHDANFFSGAFVLKSYRQGGGSPPPPPAMNPTPNGLKLWSKVGV